MPRLRRSDCSEPGFTRRRRGKGFQYLDQEGRPLREPATLERIRSLVIPPAWTDVWICPHEWGHLQAVGTDAAGRKQYRYHPRWRERRDREKFDRMLGFARALPTLRERAGRHLAEEGFGRKRVLACAVRLLDRGFFRTGGEAYVDSNDSFGLATLRKDHVSFDGDHTLVFDYPAKSGKRREQEVVDPEVAEVVRSLKRRRTGIELLAWKRNGGWVDVRSADVNDYIQELTGHDYTAKDFRTWHGTVLAAVGLAVSALAAGTKTSRKRAMRRAVQEVATYLGNTPAVARSSYIDPRIFDRFNAGVTIAGVLDRLGEADPMHRPTLQGAVEEAVLDLLEGDDDSPALQHVDEIADLAEPAA